MRNGNFNDKFVSKIGRRKQILLLKIGKNVGLGFLVRQEDKGIIFVEILLKSPESYDEKYEKWRYEDLSILPSEWILQEIRKVLDRLTAIM